MAADKFSINGKVYDTDAVDEIKLRDIMLFNKQAADMGLDTTWADVERITNEMSEMDEEEARNHPETMLMVGITVWAARRTAGEDVTFEQAVDIPVSKIVWLESPKDHSPKKGKKKSQRTPASAPAVETAPAEQLTTPPTSEEQSVSA